MITMVALLPWGDCSSSSNSNNSHKPTMIIVIIIIIVLVLVIVVTVMVRVVVAIVIVRLPGYLIKAVNGWYLGSRLSKCIAGVGFGSRHPILTLWGRVRGD